MSYIVGHPIKNPADFYGRSEQVRRFYEIVGGGQAQSISVRGLRRAGKTSFLQHISHPDVMAAYLPDPDRYVMVYVDMSFCRTPGEFYHRVLNRLKRRLGAQEARAINGQYGTLGDRTMHDVEDALAQVPNRRVILLLDEFDQMHTETFDATFLVELRALTSVWSYDLACVTASYWDLYTLGGRIGLPPTSPFYNIFYPTPIYIPGLEPDEAEALIRQPARDARLDLRRNDVAIIQRLAGSLPFFLQATAAEWTRHKRAGGAVDARAVLRQMLAELTPYFDQWWRLFTNCERDLLRYIAGERDPSRFPCGNLELNDATRNLNNLGLVIERPDGLELNGAIVTAWIKREARRLRERRATGPLLEQRTHDDIDPVAVRQVLTRHFSLDEMKTLCFDLGMDFDQLPGTNKGAKARDLVLFWQRRGELARLVEAIRFERGVVV